MKAMSSQRYESAHREGIIELQEEGRDLETLGSSASSIKYKTFKPNNHGKDKARIRAGFYKRLIYQSAKLKKFFSQLPIPVPSAGRQQERLAPSSICTSMIRFNLLKASS